MSKDTEFVIIGKIGATYGIKGWLKIISFTESIPDILEYDPWYLEDNQTWKRVKVVEGRPHGKGIVAKFTGFNTPEEARVLTGKAIAISRAQLPKLRQQEYYWSDLEGLTVVDQHDAILGKVAYIMETGSNDVLVVKGEKEIAIPYLPEVITSIDLTEKVMRVNWELI